MAGVVRKAIITVLTWSVCASVWALPPLVQDDFYVTDEDVQVDGNVLDNDSPDGAGNTLTVVSNSSPSVGTLTGVDPSSGKFTYQPPADFSGEVTFTYVARENDPIFCLVPPLDPQCEVSGTVVIHVRAVADVPGIATGSPITAAEDTPSIPLGITLNQVDTDGSQTLTALVRVPPGASLSAGTPVGGDVWDVPIGALPGLALIPPPNVNGSGSVDLEVTVRDRAFDGGGVLINEDTDKANASISITLTPVNDPPLADGPVPSVVTDEDVDASVSMAATFSDVDIATNGDFLTYDVTAITLILPSIPPPCPGRPWISCCSRTRLAWVMWT